MFDSKVIRRRRAALAVFVALSLGMLTIYFGESSGGVFHTLQRGAQEAFAPFETGASRAFKPARDLIGWFGDTFEAKGEKYKLSVLGGNMLENKLAGTDGVAGLEALAAFLRSAPK